MALFAFLPVALIWLAHALLPASYLASSVYKILFLLPIFWRRVGEKTSWKDAFTRHLSPMEFKKHLRGSLLLGIALALIYGAGFFIASHFLDVSNIATSLRANISLSTRNIVFVGLYIIFINSFLEEFFWRGFLYESISRRHSILFTHLIIAIGFAAQHAVFFLNWFSWPITVFMSLALASFSIIMGVWFRHTRSILSCWLTHGIVDIVQIAIAVSLLRQN